MTTLNPSRSLFKAGVTSRWTIAWLVFIIYLINFADRGVLGAVAPMLMKEYHFSIKQFGIIGSAFGWGYTTVALFSGLIVAKLGPKRTFMYFVCLWSLCIFSFSFANGFASFLLLRCLFGASEGVSAPAAVHLLGAWFPAQERGKAVMFLPLSVPLGTLIITPITILLSITYGWQIPFIVLGLLGPIWVLFFRKYASDKPPIDAQLAITNADFVLKKTPTIPWTQIVRSWPLWIASLGVFAVSYFHTFLLNFLPLYLLQDKHIELKHIAYMGTIPWISMALGAVVSGSLSDYVYKKTGNLRFSRSYLAGGCLLLCGAFVVALLFVSSLFSAICLISAASFIVSLAQPPLFAMPIDLFPNQTASAMSLFTVIGTLGGVLAPLLTGLVVSATGSFYFAFVLISGISVAGGTLLIALWKPPGS